MSSWVHNSLLEFSKTVKSAIFTVFSPSLNCGMACRQIAMLNIVGGEILLCNSPYQSLLSAKVKTPNEETRSHERECCCCCHCLPPASAITWPWQGFKFSCGLWQHRQKSGWMSSRNVTVDCWCIRKDTDSLILDHSALFVTWQRSSQALALFHVRLTTSHLHTSCDMSSQLMRLSQRWLWL